jgi:hypothetical protein
MAYTPPENDAVNFALTVYSPTSINRVGASLSEYTQPENDAVNFSLSIYVPIVFNGIDFDLAGAAVSYYGILKRWTGAAWIKEPVKTWLADSWQSKSLKRWTGADWLLIDTTGI